jgi:signal transduction histidine kinase
MSNLGESLRSSEDGGFTDTVGTIRSALRLPYAEIRVGMTVVAAEGEPAERVHAVELRYRGSEVGALSVGLRRGERRLDSADTAVLDLIAVPLASAVQATALSRQLQASREHIVAATEDERRRLHRELHDGLGPTLTGVAFKADAAGNLADTDPLTSRRLLAELRADIGEAIADVRRVVLGLRPPTLDEVGLIGALRRQADGLPLTITVDGPATLPPLPAAVEVAALRIAVEALNNAARHAGGRTAQVSVRVDDALHVVVTDDGSRREPWLAGVGLTSIRERVAELGGTCACGPTDAGGRVDATLPLQRRTP